LRLRSAARTNSLRNYLAQKVVRCENIQVLRVSRALRVLLSRLQFRVRIDLAQCQLSQEHLLRLISSTMGLVDAPWLSMESTDYQEEMKFQILWQSSEVLVPLASY